MCFNQWIQIIGIVVSTAVAVAMFIAVRVSLRAATGIYEKEKMPRAGIFPLKANIKHYDRILINGSLYMDVSFISFPFSNFSTHVAENVFVRCLRIILKEGNPDEYGLKEFEPFILNIVGGHDKINLYPKDLSNQFNLGIIHGVGVDKDKIQFLPAPGDNPRLRGWNPIVKRGDYYLDIGIYGDNIPTRKYGVEIFAANPDPKSFKVTITEIE